MFKLTYKKTDVYDELKEECEIFEYYVDVLVFMAVLGYRAGEIETEDYMGDEDAGTVGRMDINMLHKDNQYHAVVAALAFQKTNDPSAMADPEVHAEVIAQYAAAGLKIYEQEFGEVAGDPVDALANYIKSTVDEKEITSEDDELQTIIQSFEDETFNTS